MSKPEFNPADGPRGYKPVPPDDTNRLVQQNSGLNGIPPEAYVGEPPNRLVRVWLFHEKEWRNVEPVDAREIIAQGFGNLVGPKA